MSYIWQCKKCKTIVELDCDNYQSARECEECKSRDMECICKIPYVSVS